MTRPRHSSGCVRLTACTRPQSEESTGRELNIGATTEPAGLDMITTTGAGTSYVLLYNVYETLVKLDSEGNIKPLLASEWSVTPDLLTYTFSRICLPRIPVGLIKRTRIRTPKTIALDNWEEI